MKANEAIAVLWACRSKILQRTANRVSFGCLSEGRHPDCHCRRPGRNRSLPDASRAVQPQEPRTVSPASPCLSVLSLPLTVYRACRRNQWPRRLRVAATLAAFLCLGAVCTPATAQVTRLPAWTEQSSPRPPIGCFPSRSSQRGRQSGTRLPVPEVDIAWRPSARVGACRSSGP